MKARMSEIIEKLTPDQCEHFAYALEQVASCYLSSSSHGALLIAAAIKKLHLVGLLKVSKSKKPSTTKFHSTWFKARFAETCKFTARNQVRKSHEVLRQTEFETPFPGQWCRLQSGAQSKKPRMVRGLRLPQGLLSRFEVFVLAETEGFEPSMRLYTPYSLSRGAPSATRSRFQHSKIISGLVEVKSLVQGTNGQFHVFFVDDDRGLDFGS